MDQKQDQPPGARLMFYAELTRRLLDSDAPVEYYIQVVRPILDGLFATRADSR